MSFENLLLADPIKKALAEENYGTATPIQRDAIPLILDGRDIVGIAQTGSGKTAAFALPVLHHIATEEKEIRSRQCRTVVLTPTRELATQVARSFEKYGKYLNVKVDTMVGGMPMPPQIKSLQRGLDVVVATPGRLVDLLEHRNIDFRATDHLILDEVDRMFDMGFIQDVKKIISNIPKTRQTLCFSATMADSIERLIKSITNEASKISVDSDSKPADKVEQFVCFLKNQDKSDLVCHLIKEEAERDAESKMLIFTSTKQGADHLRHRLKIEDLKSEALHGDKPQRVRERVLDKFRDGKTNVLIATDVAARGLDIKGIDLVINFDVPNAGDTYVHRIGRTGRAGKAGKAFSFCAEFDQQVFAQIEQFLGVDITPKTDHPFHNTILAERYASLFSMKAPAESSAGLIGSNGGGRGSNRRNKRSRRNR